MSPGWAVVVAVGIATVVIKALGPVLVGGVDLPPRFLRIVGLLAPSLLAALVVTQVLGHRDGLVLDERLLGIGAAVVALMLRAPPLIAVIMASLVTAAVRLLG